MELNYTVIISAVITAFASMFGSMMIFLAAREASRKEKADDDNGDVAEFLMEHIKDMAGEYRELRDMIEMYQEGGTSGTCGMSGMKDGGEIPP